MKRLGITGTILDNYDTWTSFKNDASVSKDQLKELVLRRPYIRGTARYVTRHVNFDSNLLEIMADSEIWFIKAVGLFHFSRSKTEINKNVSNVLLNSGKFDKRIVNIAKQIGNAVDKE